METTQQIEKSEPHVSQGASRERLFVPRIDISEQKDSYTVLADMPGVDEHSIEVEVERNILTIEGRVQVEKHEGYRLAVRGYREGGFRRQFALPDDVDVEGIHAQVKDGVVKLVLPKSLKAQSRKIPVRPVN